MRNAARPEYGIAWAQPRPLIAKLKLYFALDHVKIFFLVRVEVERRSALREIQVLNDKQSIACLPWKHLEQN
jgi:hypothetical protein